MKKFDTAKTSEQIILKQIKGILRRKYFLSCDKTGINENRQPLVADSYGLNL